MFFFGLDIAMRCTCSEQSYFAKRDLAIPFEELLNIRCAKGFCHCSKCFLVKLKLGMVFRNICVRGLDEFGVFPC